MACLCQGEPIEFQDIRAPEQRQLMTNLLPMIQAGLQRGATPYPGQLSAPYDPGQTAAMNTMMGLGGYGGYQAPQMPMFPLSVQQPNIPQPPPTPPVPPVPPHKLPADWWESWMTSPDPYASRRGQY